MIISSGCGGSATSNRRQPSLRNLFNCALRLAIVPREFSFRGVSKLFRFFLFSPFFLFRSLMRTIVRCRSPSDVFDNSFSNSRSSFVRSLYFYRSKIARFWKMGFLSADERARITRQRDAARRPVAALSPRYRPVDLNLSRSSPDERLSNH